MTEATNKDLYLKTRALNHDISNYLQRISLSTELIGIELSKRPQEDFKFAQSQLDFIMENIRSIKYIMHDVLDEGGKKTELKTKTLVDVISDLVNQYQITCGNNVRSYEFYDQTNKTEFDISKEKVIRIINNLLSNATKYTPYGQIIVELLDDENYVILGVKDSGVGIEKERLKSIFNQRKHATENKEQKPGEGIGLNIVKNLVNQMNGAIEVSSTINKGTHFYIRIPKRKADNSIEKLENLVKNLVEVNNKICYKLISESDVEFTELANNIFDAVNLNNLEKIKKS